MRNLTVLYCTPARVAHWILTRSASEGLRYGARWRFGFVSIPAASSIVCSVLFAGLAWAQPSPVAEKKPATPEALKAEIEALKADKVAWREIAWKSCLIEGLKESREKHKPVLLWVFIDRPIDDARC